MVYAWQTLRYIDFPVSHMYCLLGFSDSSAYYFNGFYHDNHRYEFVHEPERLLFEDHQDFIYKIVSKNRSVCFWLKKS